MPAVPMRPFDVGCAVAVPVLWGLGFTVAKHALESFPPLLLTSLRFLIAAAILVGFVRPMWRRSGRLFLTALIGGTLAYGMQFTGLADLYASTAALAVQIEVVFLALLGALVFKDRLTPGQLAAMAVALGGVTLIAGDPGIEGDPLPLVLVVVGGGAWALGQILIKTLGVVDGMRLIAWFAAFVGPQLLIASLVLESGHWRALTMASTTAWLEVAYLSLVMTAAAYAVWYRLLASHRTSQVAPFLLLVPLTSVAGGVLLLGEEPTAPMIAGGIAVTGAVGYMHATQGRHAGGRRGA